LLPRVRHASEFVREAALIGLTEAGGREIARPAMPALKDESVSVRMAAARAVAAAGDPASTTVLIRRLEQEPDEGVLAELLRAIGRLGANEAFEVLARYAEPGGVMNRRSTTVRAAAVERLLVGLLTGGHILLEGVPGLAKTLAVRTVAECLRIAFSRIQFTPDLLPADVIGTMVFDQRSQEFYPKKGPLFANLVLADEI